MTQEQLMKVKIKYLEDRITTMEKSVERLHKIVGTMDRYKEQGFKDVEHLSKDNGNELI